MAIVFKGKKGAGTITVESGHAIVGTRSTCRLVIDDPMVAEEHCAFHEDGGVFYVEDLGTSVGTYLDGIAVEGRMPLPIEGKSTIVLGVSKFFSEIDTEKGIATLTLKEQSFYYDKKADPLKWSRLEVAFGRFSPVRLGNWIAIVLTIALFGLCFVDAVEEPLVEPGPVADVHTQAYWEVHAPERLAAASAAAGGAESCSLCHDGFRGTPAERCESCHQPIFDETVHPWSWDDHSCQPCHVDHRGADRSVLMAIKAEDSCGQCHDPDLQPSTPLGTRDDLPWVQIAYDTFPHDVHLSDAAKTKGVEGCATCHQQLPSAPDADRSAGRPRREFEPMTFESCRKCHEDDAPDEKLRMKVAWHGAADDDGANCKACHGKLFDRDLRKVPRVPRADPPETLWAWAVVPRDHHPELTEMQKRDPTSCVSCHRDGKVKGAALKGRPFFHGLHVSATDPSAALLSKVDGQCRTCHADVVGGMGAQGLTSGHYAGPDDLEKSCRECHDTGVPVRTLRPSIPEPVPSSQFPHAYHLDTTKPELDRGCLSCHPVGSGLRDPHVPATTAAARSCTPCHQTHDNVGGGDCDRCHAKDDPVYTGRKIARLWPRPNAFSHWSRGHTGEDCNLCHQDTDQAKKLSDLQIPAEQDESCRECHIAKKARFHWK
ncbi:MAG: hypothetical protein CMJ83_12155 [Planctomycetes bacterium]|nr:hypothetical protein [Planctomycetota bacterium]